MPLPFGRFDRAALVLTLAALLAWTMAPATLLTAATALAAGTANALRLARWRGHRTLADPLVWVLHMGYAWIPAGLVLTGLGIFWPTALPGAAGLHALTAGAIGTMTLAVMTRATLGHSGRPLTAGPGTVLIYACLSLGALLRVAAPISSASELLVLISGALWGAAFLLVASIYGPLLVRPRAGERLAGPAARRQVPCWRDQNPGLEGFQRASGVRIVTDVEDQRKTRRIQVLGPRPRREAGRHPMATATESKQGDPEAPPSRRQELFMFALLAILIWPVIAVAVVGGYGFLVWMWQLVFGPPGPPG